MQILDWQDLDMDGISVVVDYSIVTFAKDTQFSDNIYILPIYPTHIFNYARDNFGEKTKCHTEVGRTRKHFATSTMHATNTNTHTMNTLD